VIWAGHVTRLWEINSFILVGKPEVKITFGRPKHRWKNSIRTVLKEVRCEDMDWIYLAPGRVHDGRLSVTERLVAFLGVGYFFCFAYLNGFHVNILQIKILLLS
jgi:hypothetical protein